MSGWALLPLRLFLGVTFAFAGLQKLANPGFFDRSNPASIYAQLAGASLRSPIAGVIHHLLGAATALGIVIALAEVAIGLGVLLGLLTRVAAAGGALLSFGLFLTVSYHSNPYYTGSDIVFLFAWFPFVVAGAGGVWSLDALVAGAALRRAGSAADDRGLDTGTLDRRTVTARGLAVAGVGALGLLAAGVAAGAGRLAGGASRRPSTEAFGGQGGANPAPSGPTTTGGAPTTEAVAHPPGRRLGPARDVRVGQAATFTDPATGDPAIVLQPAPGAFVAFDTVCPHAGCTVGYSSAERLLVCPCHGSVFNPVTGAVEQGPAPTGLRRIQVAEGSDGDLYAV